MHFLVLDVSVNAENLTAQWSFDSAFMSIFCFFFDVMQHLLSLKKIQETEIMIFFCNDYHDNGKPVNPAKNWGRPCFLYI